jgi:hypothetical protein
MQNSAFLNARLCGTVQLNGYFEWNVTSQLLDRSYIQDEESYVPLKLWQLYTILHI